MNSAASDNPAVSIVIPVFNQAALTKQCLEGIEAATPPGSYEIIVVDNASTDETPALLKGWRNRPRSIRNAVNLGFARACNQGAKLARGKYLVFLNNDTKPFAGWMEACLRRFETDPGIGIVGGKLLYPDGSIQHAGIEFVHSPEKPVSLWPEHRFRRFPGDHPRVNQCEEVHAVTGACLFIPRNLFWRVGGFSEDYQMYFEDVELNLKVRALGLAIVYEPASVLTHYERQSSKENVGLDLLRQSAGIFYGRWNDKLPELLIKWSWTRRRMETEDSLQVKLDGLFYNASGYSTALRGFATGLEDRGVSLQIRSAEGDAEFTKQVDPLVHARLQRMSKNVIRKDVYIAGCLPYWNENIYQLLRKVNPGFGWYVGYTMFETDRIPDCWIEPCNQMDEIWAPSSFNRETFQRSGISAEKIRIVPIGIDTKEYQDPSIRPFKIDGRRGFAFFSVFEWSPRKGCDVLLKAYLLAFSAADDVCLILHASICEGKSVAQRVTECIASLGRSLNDCPPIIISSRILPQRQLISLYRSADAFVLPSRGEGWGIPYMEAMATGLPTIGTRWSAHLDFMNDENSYLIDCEVTDIPEACLSEPPLHRRFYAGHRWAEPSVQHTAQLMREVFEHREAAREKGRRAREDITRCFDTAHVAQNIVEELQRIKTQQPGRFQTARARKTRRVDVKWDAVFLAASGYSSAARFHALSLDRAGVSVQVGLMRSAPVFMQQMDADSLSMWKRLSEATIHPDVNVIACSPFFDRDLYQVIRGQNPGFAYYVGYTMFETDRLPTCWINPCLQMDEIWVPSRFNRETFARAGIPEDKLQVVPIGVDEDVYHPEGIKPMDIPGRKRFMFLSVFEWSHRKGWDVLLKTYLDAFSEKDDVTLLIHAWVDKGKPVCERVREFMASMGRSSDGSASVVVIENYLSPSEMLSLYRAADAFVLPTHGEGWGLPYMEAMAMGLPTIGTRWSAHLDFMTDQNSYLIDCELAAIPDDCLGERPLWREFYAGHRWAAPSLEHTGRLMREVYENPAQGRQRGAIARSDILRQYNRASVAAGIVAHLERIGASETFRARKRAAGDDFCHA